MRRALSLCLALALFVFPQVAQARSRLVTAQLNSASLSGNRIGISPLRNLTVYLPPHYADGDRHFPVLYFLNSFFEDQAEPFASHDAQGLLDRAIGAGVIGDIIMVTADFTTPAGSSWYVNSPVTGKWDDFMVRELVPYIDSTYRTLAARESHRAESQPSAQQRVSRAALGPHFNPHIVGRRLPFAAS